MISINSLNFQNLKSAQVTTNITIDIPKTGRPLFEGGILLR